MNIFLFITALWKVIGERDRGGKNKINQERRENDVKEKDKIKVMAVKENKAMPNLALDILITIF